MFENLLHFWKVKDFLSQVLEEFKDMLNDSHQMFLSVCKKLIDNESFPDLKQKIYDVDKKINVLERDIRKRVVEHLCLQPSKDVSAGLLLMSVVKDAERLGDYCKNLFEVTQLLSKPIDKEKYTALFDSMQDEISALFSLTNKAFVESNEEEAAKAWEYQTRIGKRCDEIVADIAKSDLSTNEAVCFTLIARYFKRLISHLTNIATSVILPIDALDYFDEKRKAEAEEKPQIAE